MDFVNIRIWITLVDQLPAPGGIKPCYITTTDAAFERWKKWYVSKVPSKLKQQKERKEKAKKRRQKKERNQFY